MKDRAVKKSLIARIFRSGFVRDERGVTAVEFGLLGVPFFAIVGAILETGLVFLSSQVLDSAVDNAVRVIRTGEAQSQTIPMTAAGFRSAICEYTYGLFDCAQLKIGVRTIANFSAASTSSPIDPDTGDWLYTEQYSPGIGSSVIIVEAYYKWPTILNFAGFDLATTPDGNRLMGAVRVFRNEPF